jgi:glycosyltransferase involved in cell wall biosynthesis
MRVLYSFPHKLGADRICYTAWQQVRGLVSAGVDVLLFSGALSRPVPDVVEVHTTLSRCGLRLPYRLLGKLRALALHDRIVARHLEKLVGQVDVVHVWPCAALETIKTAKRLGIPTVLERPNAHTRFAYEVVNNECRRIGVDLPRGHEYEWNDRILRHEEEEFRLTDFLLCPSEFVAKTFRETGYSDGKLLRHQYGFDEKAYYPRSQLRKPGDKLTMLFVGQGAVRKGVHFAVEAWQRFRVTGDGSFYIAGNFIPKYRQYVEQIANGDPSIAFLGHRTDVADLMRDADVLVLPSLEEGSPLVCAEAMACGCVNLVSDVCAGVCQHMENALIHRVSDVSALAEHLCLLYKDHELLTKLREGALQESGQFTWSLAGASLLKAYEEALSRYLAAATHASRQLDTIARSGREKGGGARELRQCCER